MQNQSEKWLNVLGLASGATEQAVREAYRDLVKVWHPDRFGNDSRLRRKAEERLRDLNDAFAHLQNYRPPAPSSDDRPATGAGAASGSARSSVPAAAPLLSISGRMAATLIASGIAGAVAVSLVLAGRRGTGERPAATTPLEAPAAQDRTQGVMPDRQDATASRPHVIAATRVKPEISSPAAQTMGSVRVESQPTGARVSFDGEAIGDTPLIVTDIAPGEHQIGLDLEAKGYKRWSSSIVVSAGREEKLLAIMTPGTAAR